MKTRLPLDLLPAPIPDIDSEARYIDRRYALGAQSSGPNI
jgi:hypothetical protein